MAKNSVNYIRITDIVYIFQKEVKYIGRKSRNKYIIKSVW